jgi:hypothetical protein
MSMDSEIWVAATESIQAGGECNKAESFGSNRTKRRVYAPLTALHRNLSGGSARAIAPPPILPDL